MQVSLVTPSKLTVACSAWLLEENRPTRRIALPPPDEWRHLDWLCRSDIIPSPGILALTMGARTGFHGQRETGCNANEYSACVCLHSAERRRSGRLRSLNPEVVLSRVRSGHANRFEDWCLPFPGPMKVGPAVAQLGSVKLICKPTPALSLRRQQEFTGKGASPLSILVEINRTTQGRCSLQLFCILSKVTGREMSCPISEPSGH